jgi:spermidine synthase
LKNRETEIRQRLKKVLGCTDISQTKIVKGNPYLKDYEGILALHFDALSVQSEMRIDQPDELVLSYTRAMMSFLLLEPSPKRIAMIGLGGGSMAKYCYRHLPQTEIAVIEINPDVVALRNEFAIPADDTRFKILLGDGAKFVTDTVGLLDVLMVDGYDAGGLPAQLSSQRFYDDCYTSLADNGMMVVNLWGSNLNYKEYLARICSSFANRVVVMSVDDSLNKIAIAVKNSKFTPSPSTIRHNANLLSISHPLKFQGKSNKLISAFLIAQIDAVR